jgi:hypothetical protein
MDKVNFVKRRLNALLIEVLYNSSVTVMARFSSTAYQQLNCPPTSPKQCTNTLKTNNKLFFVVVDKI